MLRGIVGALIGTVVGVLGLAAASLLLGPVEAVVPPEAAADSAAEPPAETVAQAAPAMEAAPEAAPDAPGMDAPGTEAAPDEAAPEPDAPGDESAMAATPAAPEAPTAPAAEPATEPAAPDGDVAMEAPAAPAAPAAPDATAPVAAPAAPDATEAEVAPELPMPGDPEGGEPVPALAPVAGTALPQDEAGTAPDLATGPDPTGVSRSGETLAIDALATGPKIVAPPPAAPAAPAPDKAPRIVAESAAPAPARRPAPGSLPRIASTETVVAPQAPAVPEAAQAPEAPAAPAETPEVMSTGEADAPEAGTENPDGVITGRLPTIVQAPEPGSGPAPEPAAVPAAGPETAPPAGQKTVVVGPESPGAESAQQVVVGRLPSIGRGGEPAAEAAPEPALIRNAIAFDNPERRPLLAVLLVDTGGDRSGLADLGKLPFPITVAVDAGAADAAAAMAFYRAQGAELSLAVPLPAGARPADVDVTLQAYAPLLDEAAEVFMDDPGFQAMGPAAAQLGTNLAETGHGLVALPQGLDTGSHAVTKAGVHAGLVFRDLDSEGQDGEVIRRFLDNAAFRARSETGVIVLAHTRPETLQALLEWSLGTRAQSVALAPVSAVLEAE